MMLLSSKADMMKEGLGTTTPGGSQSSPGSLRVLVFCGTYMPYTPSGVLRAVANTVDRLGGEINFTVVTQYMEEFANEGIQPNDTCMVGKARVHYASPERLGWMRIADVLNQFEYDLLWLNSCFTDFTIKPLLQRLLGRISQKPVVLTPHGELAPGALQFKALKKKAFLNVAKWIGLYRGVTWMATGKQEQKYIRSVIEKDVSVQVARNIPDKRLLDRHPIHEKEHGKLSAVFLSRISPKKNLDGALEILSGLDGYEIDFDIYGPIQDEQYWSHCEDLTGRMPGSIKVRYRGTVPYEDVQKRLSDYDLFFLPTHNENYGYVILEALAARCPVLISDETPWDDILERKAGWIVPLNDREGFRTVLREVTEMDAASFSEYRHAAYDLARSRVMDPEVLEENRDLFISTAGR